jgi:hypothetical protein
LERKKDFLALNTQLARDKLVTQDMSSALDSYLGNITTLNDKKALIYGSLVEDLHEVAQYCIETKKDYNAFDAKQALDEVMFIKKQKELIKREHNRVPTRAQQQFHKISSELLVRTSV